MRWRRRYFQFNHTNDDSDDETPAKQACEEFRRDNKKDQSSSE
ncbi:MAG: hypothetical protein ACR2KZ_06930 [Segetibacter sp.]